MSSSRPQIDPRHSLCRVNIGGLTVSACLVTAGGANETKVEIANKVLNEKEAKKIAQSDRVTFKVPSVENQSKINWFYTET